MVGVGALEQNPFEDFVAGSSSLEEKLNAAGSKAKLISLGTLMRDGMSFCGILPFQFDVG